MGGDDGIIIFHISLFLKIDLKITV